MRDVPLKSGDDYDALTRGGRRVHHFKPRVRSEIKRRFRRRERRHTKGETLMSELTDADMRAFEAEAAELIAHMTRFVKKNYGRRCREHEDGCPVCEMWRRIDWFKERTS